LARYRSEGTPLRADGQTLDLSKARWVQLPDQCQISVVESTRG
jgi:hypothetical protein